MPEIEADYGVMIEILREARDPMREGLEFLGAQEVDREALLEILTVARSFADQAESLLRVMCDSGSDQTSALEANELARAFQATEHLIEMALGLHRL